MKLYVGMFGGLLHLPRPLSWYVTRQAGLFGGQLALDFCAYTYAWPTDIPAAMCK